MNRGRPSFKWIFLLGATAALVYLAAVPRPAIVGDAGDYDRLASWLASTNFFSFDGVHPSVLRPPFYPFFVSLVYRMVGHLPFAALFVQCLLSGGTAAILSRWLALDVSERRSQWAGAACAVYPVLIAYASYLLSETLFTFLLTLGAWLYRRSEKTGPADAAGSGFVFGLATLTRSIILYFPLFWILTLLIKRRRLPMPIWIWIGVFIATLTPWAIRNYARFGIVTPVSIGGGYALWAGAQPRHYPNTMDYEQFIAPYHWDDPVADKVGTAKAARLYLANLPAVILDIPRRSAHFWLTSHSAIFGFSDSLGDYMRARRWMAIAVKLGGFALQVTLLTFALYGAVRSRDRSETLFPATIVIYTWLLIVLTDYEPNRYHVPLVPLLIYLGTRGL